MTTPILLIIGAAAGLSLAKHVAYVVGTIIHSRKGDDTCENYCLTLLGRNQFSLSVGDRISEMPNEILSDILSRLPLRETVRMAILSKRCSDLWKHLPCLDLDWYAISGSPVIFTNSDKKRCDRFRKTYVKNVEQVLYCYKDQNISSFKLSFCFDKRYAANVSKWINFGTRKCVESLNIQLMCGELTQCGFFFDHECDLHYKNDQLYIISIDSVSQFSHLKFLSLHSCILKFNGHFGFNKLIVLDLNRVLMEEEEFEMMLSCSSAIERLRITKCILPRKLCIKNNLQKLSFIMIDNCSKLQEIECSVEKLNTFDLVSKYYVKCRFKHLSKPENVYIFLINEVDKARYVFSDIANYLPDAKSLCMTGNYPLITRLPTSPFAVFKDVSWLQLVMKHSDEQFCTLQYLPLLMISFPKLKKLNICLPIAGDYYPSPSVELPAIHLHTNLEEVELGGFERKWLGIAIYILKSCVVLEGLVLSNKVAAYIGWGQWCRFSTGTYRDYKDIPEKLHGISVSPRLNLIID